MDCASVGANWQRVIFTSLTEMPFWSDETWRALPDDAVPVEPFSAEHLEEAKYVMAVGNEIFISSNAAGNTIRILKQGESFQIAPGQFAYILTAERLKLPPNAIGFISINAKTKFFGLVNISGFHVDPGYHGKIIFSVFNAGPTSIHLKSGQRIFPIWIANLDKNIKNPSPKPGYENIPPDLISSISGNYTTAFELNVTIEKLRDDISKMKEEAGQFKATTREEIAQVKSVRYYMITILTIIGLAFSGVFADNARALYSWLKTYNAAITLKEAPVQERTPDPTGSPLPGSQLPLTKTAPTK